MALLTRPKVPFRSSNPSHINLIFDYNRVQFLPKILGVSCHIGKNVRVEPVIFRLLEFPAFERGEIFGAMLGIKFKLMTARIKFDDLTVSTDLRQLDSMLKALGFFPSFQRLHRRKKHHISHLIYLD